VNGGHTATSRDFVFTSFNLPEVEDTEEPSRAHNTDLLEYS